MTLQIPDSVIARAKVSAILVPACANVATPKLTEATAGVEMTCFFPAVWDGITNDQDSNTQTRMCLAEDFQVPGNVKRSIADIEYTYLPQALLSVAGNKLYAAATPGTAQFLFVRYGLSVATAGAIGDKVDVIGVTLGARSKKPGGSGGDDSAPLTVMQKIFINRAGGYAEDVAMIA